MTRMIGLTQDTSAGGGYQAAGSLEALHAGAKVIIAGLFVQLLFFGFFIVIAIKFDISISKAPTAQAQTYTLWKRHMWALYIGSLLVMVRSIFRAVEYLQGFDGYLLSYEAYLYIFDAVLMLLVMALFNHVHPSEVASLLASNEGEWTMGTLPKYYYGQRIGSSAA
jgi:SNF family Na+-dependent transporter